MNKEELLNLPMVVCSECGWEIIRSIWNAPMCDDCAMNKDMEQQLEKEGK